MPHLVAPQAANVLTPTVGTLFSHGGQVGHIRLSMRNNPGESLVGASTMGCV